MKQPIPRNGDDTEILMHVIIIYNLAVTHYFWDPYTLSAAIVLLAVLNTCFICADSAQATLW